MTESVAIYLQKKIAAYKAEGREAVVRMRMPDGSTTFVDEIRGEVSFDHKFVPDFVLSTRRWFTAVHTGSCS